MAYVLSSLADLDRAPHDALIDVRSPAEYAEDHIPGAFNLPVLDDAERARVGTIYSRENPFKARKIGAALVASNAARHLETALIDKDGGWRPLVYCWRGGQRSGSFTSILKQVGWRAQTIEGGYRTYRRLVVRELYETPFTAPVTLLGGNTGTAKTALLERLQARGVQVIDLEGLAHHRGSVFGARPGGQPSQKAFETALAQVIGGLDQSRPVVIEAESSKVSQCMVPPALWAAMKAAPRLEITAPLAARARYLVSAYSDIIDDPARLADTLDKLRPFHAAGQIDDWQALARAGDMQRLAAELMAAHYDPRYAKGHEAAQRAQEIQLGDLKDEDLDRAVDRIAGGLSRDGASGV